MPSSEFSNPSFLHVWLVFFQKGVVAEEKEAEGEKSNKPKRKRKASIVTSAVRMRGRSKKDFSVEQYRR